MPDGLRSNLSAQRETHLSGRFDVSDKVEREREQCNVVADAGLQNSDIEIAELVKLGKKSLRFGEFAVNPWTSSSSGDGCGR